MANPDSGNLPSKLANKPPKFKRKHSGTPSVPDKVTNWAGIVGKTGPSRSAGVTKLKQYPQSTGL